MLNQFLFYFELGMDHILQINGLDHILFLVVLIIAYTFKDWKSVLWLVTAFTIGHTLSLVLSTYGAVKVNPKAVEFFVLITIFLMAIYNVFTAGKNTSGKSTNIASIVLLIAALFFGIIHGLAFAKDFKSMITAGTDEKLLPLLEFTLGIEVAQIIVVIIVLIISFIFQTVFRFSKRDWVMVVSAIVIGVLIPTLIKARFW